MIGSAVLFTVTMTFLYPYCSSNESSSEMVMDCFSAECYCTCIEKWQESNWDCQFKCTGSSSVGNCSEGYYNRTSDCNCLRKFAHAHNCSEYKCACFTLTINESVFEFQNSECDKDLVTSLWVLGSCESDHLKQGIAIVSISFILLIVSSV
jgi:hypothetical protein